MYQSVFGSIHKIIISAGGLGLFLYGMTVMSSGLEQLAGDKMRSILERATANRFLGVLVGAVSSCVMQSSSAVTVMSVGFVNAGMLTLSQAIGVIMGANIGTTITAQIVSFKIDAIAPLAIFTGMVMRLVSKKKRIVNLGYILLGFGILFFGITVMGEPMEELSRAPAFQSLLMTFSNPLLALICGALFTAVIQSSSATTSIIVTMCLNDVDLPFQTAAFIVLGSNIGTCITAMLACLTANRESRRTALVHVLFNVIGSALFGLAIVVYPGLLSFIQSRWAEPARRIAMFHTIFNISTTVVLLPFTNQLMWMVRKIIPQLETEDIKTKRLIYLDKNITLTPSIAVTQAHREVCRMADMALENLKLALDSFMARDEVKASMVIESEETIDFLTANITAWLVQIRGLSLSDSDVERVGIMLQAVSDFERVSDHAENIAEFVMDIAQHDLPFSAVALEELKTLGEMALDILSISFDSFKDFNTDNLPKIEVLEQSVDDAATGFIHNHIRRMRSEACDPYSGVIFTDMVSNLERCADHAYSIAKSLTD